MDFENNFGRQVGQISHWMGIRLNQSLQRREVGITADQFRLLTALWKEDGITQQRLAHLLGRDRATVTRMVDLLENQSIILRVPDREDKRSNLVYLTKKGKTMEAEAAAAAQEVLDLALGGFSEAERQQVQSLLQRAIDNLK